MAVHGDVTAPALPASLPLAHRVRALGRVLLLFPLGLAMILYVFTAYGAVWVHGGPSGVGIGSDFAMFYNAARILHAGGNPYDHLLLYHTEQSVFHAQHIEASNLPDWVRVGNPTLFFWLIEPLARLPFRQAGWTWIWLMALCSSVGFAFTLATLGWRKVLIVPLVPAFLAMPETFLGIFYGNVVPIIFAGIAAGFAALRSRPILAGALMVVAWLKPSVALPFVMLIFLFHAPDRRRFAAGFAAATALAVLATGFVAGWHSFGVWIQGLEGYSRDIAQQPEMSTLTGLYVQQVGAGVRQVIQGVSVLAALAITAVVWRRAQGRKLPVLPIAWLWALWFLAVPYAHNDDVILLTIPILALIGRDGLRATRLLSVLALYLLFSIVLYSPIPGISTETECLKLAGVAVCLAFAARSARYQDPQTDAAAEPRAA